MVAERKGETTETDGQQNNAIEFHSYQDKARAIELKIQWCSEQTRRLLFIGVKWPFLKRVWQKVKERIRPLK